MNRRKMGREFVVKRGTSGNKHWMIAGYPTGKLERHYFSSENKAKAAAEKSNVKLRQFGEQAFSMNPATCYEAARCIVLLREVGLDFTQVVESVVADRKLELEGRKMTEIMAECLALNEQRVKRGEVSKAQLNNLRSARAKLKSAFGDVPVARMTKPDIIRW